MSRRIATGIAVAVLASICGLGAAEWPGWRGPERNGTAAGFAVPESWPEELEQRWRVRVGSGHSSPAVAAGRVFVQSREGDHEVVRALEPGKGKIVWEQRYPVTFKAPMGSGRHGPGPKASPVHDGGRLFTISVTGVLSAWAADSGELLWREEFADRFKKTRPHFGAAASPLVVGSRVISSFGGSKDGAVMALDVETGQEVWAGPGEGASYASAIVVPFGDSRHVVTMSSNAAVSFDVQTGRPRWSYTFPESMMRQNIVTPLPLGDLLVVSGKGRGITALRASSGADGWSVEPAWQIHSLAMEMSSPVQSDGRIYGLSHRDKGRIFCVDAASGEVLWTGPGRAADQASLLVVDGAILALTDSAELIVLSDSGEAYDERARYTVAESPTWAHLVPVDGGVLVKDREHLTFWSWREDMSHLRSVVIALLALATAPAAFAEGWYVQAFVGVNVADDVELDIDDGAVETSFDVGYLWGIGGGYEFKRVRLDAEIDTSRENDVDVHALDGIDQAGSTGDVQSEAGIASLLFDFRKQKRASPYVGAGVGVAEIELTGFGTDGLPTIVDDEDNLFVWQILGGVGLDVGKHWIVDFSLRYYETAEGDFDTSAAAGGQEVSADYSSFSVTAGFRYDF